MRKTLHYAPPDLAQLMHRATLRYRVRDAQRALEVLAIDLSSELAIAGALRDVVARRPGISARDLETAVRSAAPVAAVRAVLKKQIEQGQLLCENGHRHRWNGDTRTFVLPVHRIGADLDGEAQDCDEAALAARYFSAYGPATLKDFAWWSGLGQRRALQSLISDGGFAALAIEGVADPMFARRETVAELLHAATEPTEPTYALLAHEDSLLKAYFQTRMRYVPDGDTLAQIFNQIGEVIPTIVEDGIVIGTWHFDDRRGIEPKLLATPKDPRGLTDEISLLEGVLSTSQQGSFDLV